MVVCFLNFEGFFLGGGNRENWTLTRSLTLIDNDAVWWIVRHDINIEL